MKFEKSPPELVALFDEVVPDDPAVQRRQMFGYPAAFTGGNLFAGLYAASLMLRLPDDQLRQMIDVEGGRPFEPMPGRPMKGYAVVPESMLLGDRPALRAWLQRSLDAALKLPVKEPKPRKKR